MIADLLSFPLKKTKNVLDVVMSDGVWLVADTKHRHEMVVVWVLGGQIVPLKRESRTLDPERFLPGARFLGPFNPSDVL